MAHAIEFSEDAERHLSQFTARQRRHLLDEIEEQLGQQPEKPTRRRKLLRPTPLATWELRVGNFRVFYNVESAKRMVVVIAIGVKDHNVLHIDGKEYQL